jgi:hypothetical protein
MSVEAESKKRYMTYASKEKHSLLLRPVLPLTCLAFFCSCPVGGTAQLENFSTFRALLFYAMVHYQESIVGLPAQGVSEVSAKSFFSIGVGTTPFLRFRILYR